jgi:hypothetical protein
MVSWEQEQYNEKVFPIHSPFILNGACMAAFDPPLSFTRIISPKKIKKQLKM